MSLCGSRKNIPGWGWGGGGGAGSIPTLWFCACVHLLLNFLDIWTFIAKLAAFKIIAATL